MLGFLSSAFGLFSSLVDYFRQKKLISIVEDKMQAENDLEDEQSSHKRTKQIHEVELDVLKVETPKVNKKSRRITG